MPPFPSSYTQPAALDATPAMAASHWWSRANPLEWALLPLRLFLGVTFIYAGIQKVTDPQFFNERATGYIGNQIIGFVHGSPIRSFLMNVVLPHFSRSSATSWARRFSTMPRSSRVSFGVNAIGLSPV